MILKRGLLVLLLIFLVIPFLYAGCLGTATECGDLTTSGGCSDDSACMQQQGCNQYWNNQFQQCVCYGTATDCETFDNSADCEAQDGCFWEDTDINDIILRLSSSSNAHGAVYDGSTYPILIKYSDIFGSTYSGEAHPVCDENNDIIYLSGTTNAHASVPGDEQYDVAVCYGDLTCGATENECSLFGDNYKCLVSLSSNTNAHLATCDSPEAYPIKICCAPGGECTPDCPLPAEVDCGTTNTSSDGCGGTCDVTGTKCAEGYECIGECIDASKPYNYWALYTTWETLPLKEIEVELGVTNISMVVRNTQLSEGEEVTFEIFEADGLVDDDIRIGSDSIKGLVNKDGHVIVNWTISNEDIEKAKAGGEEEEYEFYFIDNITNKKSEELKVTIKETPISDYCAENQLGTACEQYKSEEDCNKDVCNVKENNEGDCQLNTLISDGCYLVADCYCEWNASIETCQQKQNLTYEGVCSEDLPQPPGICTITKDIQDTCDDDGWLTYSASGNWDWKNNVYENENSVPGEDALQDDEGKWHYFPTALKSQYESCQNIKGKSIECPSLQARLPFFTEYNFILSLILISFIYVVLISRKR